jgi:serine protease AprX
MLRSVRVSRFASIVLVLLVAAAAATAGTLDPKVTAKLSTSGASALIPVIVTYQSTPTTADATTLRSLGVTYGVTLRQLPMAGVWATPAQVRAIAALTNVRSVYLNQQLRFFNYEGSALIGASEQRTLPGFGYSGRGIGVAIVDSGVDGTHPDLPYPSHVKQNVKVLTGELGLGSPFTGVVPVSYAQNLPDSDSTSGHGTHAAGSIAGLGTQSGGKFAGVAPGCDLIGISTGEAIAVLWALEGFDYVLTHQYLYNIRVVSNSWGTSGAFDPEDPISVASKLMHDRGITVVFAAGNEGPGNNTLNPYSVAPWVIGVAAGDKQGRLADFSSRGVQGDAQAHPTIAAPGVDIVSVKANLTPLGQASPCTALAPGEIAFYACMSGTSMATPHVAGATALVLEANPTLTPDQIKSLMRATATPMAGYKEHQVGAGYLNILAAIDGAKNPGKSYGAVLNQSWNANFNGSTASESFSLEFDPTGAVPRHNYTVGANGVQTDAFISWDSSANTFNLALTDPNGTATSTGSNLTAAVYGLQASLSINNPIAGGWHVDVYGLKGMSTGTTGVGVPDTITGSLINYYGTFSGMDDVTGSPYASFIRRAVSLRLMDSRTANTFAPGAAVTRGEAAQILASDCYVRQTQLAASPYTDVPASLAPYVQAVTAGGGPLRDTFMRAGGIMDGTGATTFSPDNAISRGDLAVWLVRALGKDADARSAMSTATTFSDDSDIPANQRGYIVVASNLGLMTGFANPSGVEGAPVTYSWQPHSSVSRGALSVTIGKWYDLFMTP